MECGLTIQNFSWRWSVWGDVNATTKAASKP